MRVGWYQASTLAAASYRVIRKKYAQCSFSFRSHTLRRTRTNTCSAYEPTSTHTRAQTLCQHIADSHTLTFNSIFLASISFRSLQPFFFLFLLFSLKTINYFFSLVAQKSFLVFKTELFVSFSPTLVNSLSVTELASLPLFLITLSPYLGPFRHSPSHLIAPTVGVISYNEQLWMCGALKDCQNKKLL